MLAQLLRTSYSVRKSQRRRSSGQNQLDEIVEPPGRNGGIRLSRFRAALLEPTLPCDRRPARASRRNTICAGRRRTTSPPADSVSFCAARISIHVLDVLWLAFESGKVLRETVRRSG